MVVCLSVTGELLHYNPTGSAAGDANFWYIAGGINRDFTGYGNTSIYGEYGHYDYDNAGLVDDTVEMWGLGIVQHFDKAATELFIAYRHWDQKVDGGSWNANKTVYSASGSELAGTDGDVDQLMAGMRIKF